MERVRTGLARLGLVLREADAIGSDGALDLAVVQVPHEQGQRWVGLALAEGASPREGVVSLVLHGAEPSAFLGPLAGLLVDEWVEIVPNRKETTGIAFRYDPPDVMAPQAVLLAVPPVAGEAWTVGSLNQVLLETLDLAHLRAVDPGALGEARHFLPAAVLAFNADADAVSTDLASLAP
jgi:hypothetical protein